MELLVQNIDWKDKANLSPTSYRFWEISAWWEGRKANFIIRVSHEDWAYLETRDGRPKEESMRAGCQGIGELRGWGRVLPLLQFSLGPWSIWERSLSWWHCLPTPFSGMSGLVHKLQTAFCNAAQSFPSRPVWSPLVQAWVSSNLPPGERREKEKKDTICAQYLPMKKSYSAVHCHMSSTHPHPTIYPFHVQYD